MTQTTGTTRPLDPEAVGGEAEARTKRGRMLGSACIVGGVLVAVSGLLLDLEASGPLGSNTADTVAARFANGLFAVAVLGLMCGVLGLHVLRVGGSSWLPRMGTAMTLLGLLLWALGPLYLTTDASAEPPFSAAGGLVSSLGMIVYGIAAIRAGASGDRRRFVPLLVGVWFFVQLPVQIAFFLPVGGSPFFLLLLGGSGALWALTGWVVRSKARERVVAA